MASIKEEILSSLNVVRANPVVMEKIQAELDLMEKSEGLENQSCLQMFYNSWQRNKTKRGTKNNINSWTAWALGMTDAKPDDESEQIPMRRVFARVGFPDIDTDFDYFRRQEIYDYITEKYGRDRVANIGTHGALKMRSAQTRVIKALDIADSFHKGKDEYVRDNVIKVNEILGALPKGRGAILKVKDEEGHTHEIKTSEDAYKYCKDFRYYMDKYPEVRKHAKNIEGLYSIAGIHAAGILISNIPLERIAPVRRPTKKDVEFATQYAYEELESLGLIKFDILAISSLTVIKRCVDLVKENYGITVDIENLPLDDQPTLELYRSGKLTGVFQCETGQMQRVMMDIGVDRFEDIMAAVALYRPGPMASIPEYCARKRGDKVVDYFHPSIEKYVKPYLQKTYGILVYQEQVMQVCNALAGFSINDGYMMIKAVGKKKQDILDRYRGQFIKGCIKNGVPKDVAEEYWDKFITPFSAYGFNASHSLVYGYLSLTTAYFKANYPDEFFCACLNVENERKNFDKIELFERDMKNFGIKLLPKKLNDCGVSYRIVKKRDVSSGEPSEVMPSLMVKGVGMEAAQEIASNAPYEDLRDLAVRTSSQLVDQEVVGSLYDGGFIRQKKGKTSIPKDAVLDRFKKIRDDIKLMNKKGVGGSFNNMFGG